VKLVERDRARKLRRENGLPIKVIAAELGVSPSSVSRWVRDVELSAEQEAALRDANPIYNRHGVPSERIALTVNVHLGNGLTLEQIEDWWLIRLGLSRRSLRRAVVLVQSIFGAIPTYAGLRRSEWLG
jgi:transcriptional regulator with XRE-family HTH domain